MTPEDAATMGRRALEISCTLASHADEDARLRRERAGIIQVYRQEGWSLRRIAKQTGITCARVAQVVGKGG